MASETEIQTRKGIALNLGRLYQVQGFLNNLAPEDEDIVGRVHKLKGLANTLVRGFAELNTEVFSILGTEADDTQRGIPFGSDGEGEGAH